MKEKKMINRKQTFALVFALSTVSMLNASHAGASASDKPASQTLKGKIEARGSNRVTRPAMPPPPLGSVFDTLDKPKGKLTPEEAKKASLDNIHKNDFKFELMQSSKNDPKEAQAAELDAKDESMMIAWEAWHKRVCESIQRYWVSEPDIPAGDARVSVDIGRDGSIDFHYVSFKGTKQDQSYFEDAVKHTLQGIEHSRALIFPKGSQRSHVAFVARFQTDSEHEGYDWQHGDYERVPGR